MNTENKKSFLSKIYENKSVGMHLFINVIFFGLVYLKFHRNRCYFKHDHVIFNKYKMIMIYTNLGFFVCSGFILLRGEFIKKYDRAIAKSFKTIFSKNSY